MTTTQTDDISIVRAELMKERQARLEAEAELERRRNDVRGQAVIHQRSTVTKDDLREFLPARLAMAPLEEVVALEAKRKGLTVDEYARRAAERMRG